MVEEVDETVQIKRTEIRVVGLGAFLTSNRCPIAAPSSLRLCAQSHSNFSFGSLF